jgi:HK97 family phage portal protein
MLEAIARWLGYERAGHDERRGGSIENPAVSLNDPDAWEELGWASQSASGESVTPASMLSVGAVWQAVGMIAGEASKIPAHAYRRDGENRQRDSRHPADELLSLYGRANAELSTLLLLRRWYTHALIWPRGFVWIDRRGDGTPVGLYNLLPDRTRLARVEGRLWVLSEVGGKLEAFDIDDVLILENVAISDVEAFGPLRAARENIGVQLAKRRFTAKFFANGLHAGGVLQVPPGASDKAKAKVKESIENKRHSGDNAFRTLVLRDGFKWHTTMIAPEAAQMDSVEEAETRNVARFYRMNPSRLGVKDSVSYNSDEAARRAFYDETLSFWLIGARTEFNLKLLTERERVTRSHFVDYLIHAINWADSAALIEIGTKGVQWGIFARDEVRRWYNLNELPGGVGSQILQPLNMVVAGESEGDRAGLARALAELSRSTVQRMTARAWGQVRRNPQRWSIEEIRERLGASLGEMAGPVELACRSAGVAVPGDGWAAAVVARVADEVRECSEVPSGELPGALVAAEQRLTAWAANIDVDDGSKSDDEARAKAA